MVKTIDIENEIYNKVIKYGNDTFNDEFYINVTDADIIVDGRLFTEEYEDLPSTAPCRIDGITANILHNNLSFHVHTAFTTNFPLMSNDWYNVSILDDKTKNKIYEYINNLVKNKKPNDNFLLTERRSKWIEYAKRILNKRIYPALDFNKNKTVKKINNIKYNSFDFSFDCCFCCDNVNLDNDSLQYILNKWKEIFNDTGIQLAYIITYPTIELLRHDLYLSNQSDDRYVLQNIFIENILLPIYKSYNSKFINWVISQDPNDILINTDSFILKNINESEWNISQKIPENPTVNKKNCINNILNLSFNEPFFIEQNDELKYCYFDSINFLDLEFKKDYIKDDSIILSFDDYIKSSYSNSKLTIELVFKSYENSETYKYKFEINTSVTHLIYNNYSNIRIYPINNYKYSDDSYKICNLLNDYYLTKQNEYDESFKILSFIGRPDLENEIEMIDINGISISKYNYIIGNTCAFNKCYNFGTIIPEGYRLPKLNEIKPIISKYKFSTSKIFDTYKIRNKIGMIIKFDEETTYCGWESHIPFIAIDDDYINCNNKYATNMVKALTLSGEETYVNTATNHFIIFLVKDDNNIESNEIKNKINEYIDNLTVDKLSNILGIDLKQIDKIKYTVNSIYRKEYTLTTDNKYAQIVDFINKLYNTNINNPKSISINIDDNRFAYYSNVININKLICILWFYLYSDDVYGLIATNKLPKNINDFYNELTQSKYFIKISNLKFIIDNREININKSILSDEYFYLLQKFIFNI